MYIFDVFFEGKCKSIERVLVNSNIYTKYDFLYTVIEVRMYSYLNLVLSVKFYFKE